MQEVSLATFYLFACLDVEVATTYRIDDGRGNPTLVTGFNCYGNEGALYSCPRDNTCETFDENNSFFRIVGIKCNGEVQPGQWPTI